MSGGIYGGGIINGSTGTATLRSDSNDDLVRMYHHSHQFKNVPLHLMESSDDVRKVAEKNNKQTKIPAAPLMAKACALIFQNSVIAVKITKEIETEIRMLITKGGNLNLSQKR